MVAPANRKPSDLRQALAYHFQNFPDSPLRGMIATPRMEGLLEEFDRKDAWALRQQRAYRRFGRFALWAMLIATVLGAFALLPIQLENRPRTILEGLQGLAMLLTFIAVIWIGLRQPVAHWMQSRAEAERLRAEVFRAIMRFGVDAKELLAPALACFKEAHLDWQLGFYRKRGPQHRRSAGHITPYKVAGYVLLLAALLLGFAGLANFAAELGWASPRAIMRWIPLDRPGSWQLGLGAMASSVLAFASARSFMDQDDRNASCYELAAKELETIAREDLPKAQAAAAAGSVGEVLAFCEKVQSVLSAEHGAWTYARPPDVVLEAPRMRP